MQRDETKFGKTHTSPRDLTGLSVNNRIVTQLSCRIFDKETVIVRHSLTQVAEVNNLESFPFHIFPPCPPFPSPFSFLPCPIPSSLFPCTPFFNNRTVKPRVQEDMQAMRLTGRVSTTDAIQRGSAGEIEVNSHHNWDLRMSQTLFEGVESTIPGKYSSAPLFDSLHLLTLRKKCV